MLATIKSALSIGSCSYVSTFGRRSSQYLELGALALLIVAFGLFVAPAPNHLLIWADNDGPTLQRFVTMVVGIALMPFASALAIDIYISAARTLGSTTGLILSSGTLACAMFFWYGVEAIHRQSNAHKVRTEWRSWSMAEAERQNRVSRKKFSML
jgi:hypothetical protein